MALLFAERSGAVATLAGDGPERLRAEATVVVASCRLGQRLDVVERGIAAIRLAERHSDGETTALLRVELAGCARSAGVPLVGAAIVRPVLTSDAVRPAVRADALVQLVGCLAQLADGTVLDDALAEADRHYADDADLDPDGRAVLRALLRAVASGEQRRRGDARAAVVAAQEGVDLLTSLHRPTADNGMAAASVALRLVHGLLDLGRVDEAAAIAHAELARPVRAPAASAIGWLSLAVAVRQHLAAGALVPALGLLREAAALAERHRLRGLHAEVLTTLSEAHERVGQLPEALDCLRTAQGVRLRRARAVYAARTTLVSAFGETTGPDEFVPLLGGTAGRRAVARSAAGREHAAALLDRFGMRRPIAAAVAGPTTPNTDVTMVLVDLEAGVGGADPVAEQLASQVLTKVRDAVPTEAQVARVGGAEFAVLLPSTQVGQTERWVERLRGAMADVDWTTVAPGVAVNVRVAVAQQVAAQQPTAQQPAAHQPVGHQPVGQQVAARRPAHYPAQPAFATHAAAPTAGSQPTLATASPPQRPAPPAPEIPSPEIPRPEIPSPEIPRPEIPRPEIPRPEIPSVFELPTVPIMPVGIGIGMDPVQQATGQLPATPATPQPANDQIEPATSRPSTSQPSVAQPNVVQPGIAQPWIAQPGLPQQASADSGFAQPMAAQSGLAQQGAVDLRFGRSVGGSGFAQEDAADSGIARSAAGESGSAQDGAGQRGFGWSAAAESGAAGADFAGAGSAGSASAGADAAGAASVGVGEFGVGRLGEVRAAEPGVQAGSFTSDVLAGSGGAHAGPSQSGAGESGAGESGAGESGLGQVGLGQVGAGSAGGGQHRGVVPPAVGGRSSILPALPLPPPLEPAHPVSASPIFHSTHPDDVPVSADPSVRISAADISAAGQPPADARPRHGVADDDDRSVLASLGITSGATSGGGRRRAKDDSDDRADRADRADEQPPPKTVAFDDFGHVEPLPAPDPYSEDRGLLPERERMATDPFGDWAPLRRDTERDTETAAAPEPPPVDAPPADVPPADAPPAAAVPTRTGGKRRRSVQLADLLTEALMAYQDAQDTNDTNDANDDPLAADTSLPGPTTLPTTVPTPLLGLDPAVGDELGYPRPARHRGEPEPGDARRRTSRRDSRWDSRWEDERR